MPSKLPPLIAVIGSDGSGKSTVCENLLPYVEQYGPVAQVHLGKQAGNVGRAVSKLPLMGKKVGKSIEKHKVKTATELPGMGPALVVMFFVLRRLMRFRHMLACRRNGNIILTDRYPQEQIPGAYDGTVFPANVPGSQLVSWMRKKEKKAFHWMASVKPDLVIKLNVDLDVACARKPDHRREALEKKIAITPQLTFNGAHIVNIDANKPLKEVIADAQKAVADYMASAGYGYAGQQQAQAS